MAIKFLNTAIAATQAVGDNSTKIATTAYVDAAAGAVPIGDYLPLAGGTLTGPLTGTSATFGGNVIIATSGAVNNLLITSTDTTTAGAPDIVLYADAPAVTGDTMGDVLFQGKNGMVPSSTSPLTYTGLFSKMVDKNNNHSSLVITTHKGNGSGAQALTATLSAKGVNNSATGTLLINPSSVTDVADYNLEVKGDALIQDNFYVNGNVGIGTTNPVDALDVDWDTEGVATDNSGIRVRAYRPHLNLIDRSGYGTTNGHNFQIKADLAKLWFNATSADDETFDLTRMVIDKDGNVGIGTDSPNFKLEVLGNSRFTDTLNVNASALGAYIQSSQSTGLIVRGGGNAQDIAKFQNVGGSTVAVINSNGKVGIGATNPKAKLDVNNVFCVDSKEHTITNAFTTCLTVNLTNHTGCHVVITAFGDWGSHSSAAYRGEFFLQNGANLYNEPGIILRQDDNTSDGTDQIICQIVDNPSTANPKDFQIQIRHTDTTSPASFDAQLTYTVQGKFNSIT